MMGRTAFASRVTKYEGLTAAFRKDWPARDPPNLLDYLASDLTTPTN